MQVPTLIGIRKSAACKAALCSLLMHPASEAEEVLPMPDWPVELTQLTSGEKDRIEAPAANSESYELGVNRFNASSSDANLPAVVLTGSALQMNPTAGEGGFRSSDSAGGIAAPPEPFPVDSAQTQDPVQDGDVMALTEAATGDAVHQDPITASRIKLLDGSGLLARQAEIAESIIMMERRLKQVELLNKIMALQGPDASIEVAPGRFESFSDTPAGRRLAKEIEENELKASIRILELKLKEAGLKAALAGLGQPSVKPKEAPDSPVEEPPTAPSALNSPSYSVLGIFGRNGDLSAILDAGGKGMEVWPGDRLPDGFEVRSVGPGEVVLARDGEILELRIDG